MTSEFHGRIWWENTIGLSRKKNVEEFSEEFLEDFHLQSCNILEGISLKTTGARSIKGHSLIEEDICHKIFRKFLK